MNQVTTQVQKVRQNIDPVIVTSNIAAVVILGGLLWAAQKSGFKPFKQAASVVAKGK